MSSQNSETAEESGECSRQIPKVKYRGWVKEEKLFQPSSGFGTRRNYPEKITVSTDPMILNTVHLVDHKRKLEQIINEKKRQIKKNMNDRTKKIVFPFAELPPMPKVSEQVLKRMNSEDLIKLEIQRPLVTQFYSENAGQRGIESNFVRGIGSPPPPVSRFVAYKILKKAVTALSGHAGFRVMKESALHAFTDAAGCYLSQFCKMLRMNVDRSEGRSAIGFIDSLEQTLQDVDGLSMLDLDNFYQERVIKYHGRMMLECKRLTETYKQLELFASKRLDEDNDELSVEGIEQSLAANEPGTSSLEGTAVAKEKKKGKIPKKLPQGIKESREKGTDSDDFLEDFYASELFPDELSLSIDEDSSESFETGTKKKRKPRRTKSKKCASDSVASGNTDSIKGSNVSEVPSSSASGKDEQIISGAKESKKRVSQKTLKKVTFKLSSSAKETEESENGELLLKKSPAVSRRKGILKGLAAETPGVLIGQISDSLIAKKKLKASQKLKDPPMTPSQDEALAGQAPSSTIEKSVCIETIPQESESIPQASKGKQIIMINEDQQVEAMCLSLPKSAGPIVDTGTQLVSDEQSQGLTKIIPIPTTSKIDKGKRRRAPPKVKEPEPPAPGVAGGESPLLDQNIHDLVTQQLLQTLEMKEQRKRQPPRRKIPMPPFPTTSSFVPTQGENITQMMHQIPDAPMDLSSMHSLMKLPSPISPINDTETGKKKRKQKKPRK